jgi:hypothetical protein
MKSRASSTGNRIAVGVDSQGLHTGFEAKSENGTRREQTMIRTNCETCAAIEVNSRLVVVMECAAESMGKGVRSKPVVLNASWCAACICDGTRSQHTQPSAEVIRTHKTAQTEE